MFERTISMALVALAVLGCAPRPGERCVPGAFTCADSRTALACVEGKLAAIPCKGVDGCKAASCDVRGGASGEPCIDGTAPMCTVDGKARLTCVHGVLTRDDCDGAKGCFSSHGALVCDARLVRADDACADEGHEACGRDGTSAFVCRAGKFALAAKCRGPKGCSVDGRGSVACDVSVGAPGDPCVDGARSCADDGVSLLECRAGAYVGTQKCRGPNGCRISFLGRSQCDEAFDVGDPCDAGDTACRVDGTATLRCRGGVFVLDEPCAAKQCGRDYDAKAKRVIAVCAGGIGIRRHE